jgi:hypothetical protein
MSEPRDPRDPWRPADTDDTEYSADTGYTEDTAYTPDIGYTEDTGYTSAGVDSETTDGWPARDFDDEVETDVAATNAPPIVVAGGNQAWDTRRWGDRRKPTTAEQAVPWLVGLVLALSGIVIVLLALIFTDANGGLATVASSGSPTPALTSTPIPTASAASTRVATPSASPTTAPTPLPRYGSLDMLYLARPNALATSELMRDDFASSAAARVVAKSSVDVAHYAVSADGTRTVAIIGGKLLAVVAGKPARTLANVADAATFSADGATVYAVRVTRGGANDDATISAIAYATGKATTFKTINFRHPAADQLTALGATRFFDDGGAYRLYSTSDGNLVFWVRNGGQWRVDPVSGDALPASRHPILWSPDGSRRITVGENGLVTTLAVLNQSGATSSRVTITGLISHLRWSPRGNRVVFTLGINSSSGGVRQDLYTWDLVNGRVPVALTANGASFGGDWLGVAQFWQP